MFVGGRGCERAECARATNGRQLFDFLVVDDNVRALWVVDVVDGRAAVLDGHLFHVLRFLLGETVEGDAERVERLEIEFLELKRRMQQ